MVAAFDSGQGNAESKDLDANKHTTVDAWFEQESRRWCERAL